MYSSVKNPHTLQINTRILLTPNNYYKIFDKKYYKMIIKFFLNEHVGESSIFSDNVLIAGPNIKYLRLDLDTNTRFEKKRPHTNTHIYLPANIETFIIGVSEYKFKLHKKITCLKIKNTNSIPNLTNKLKYLEIVTSTVQTTGINFPLPNKLTHFLFESCTSYCFNFPKTIHALVLNFRSDYTHVLIFPKSLKYMSLIFNCNYFHHIQFPSKVKYLSLKYTDVPKLTIPNLVTHLCIICTLHKESNDRFGKIILPEKICCLTLNCNDNYSSVIDNLPNGLIFLELLGYAPALRNILCLNVNNMLEYVMIFKDLLSESFILNISSGKRIKNICFFDMNFGNYITVYGDKTNMKYFKMCYVRDLIMSKCLKEENV